MPRKYKILLRQGSGVPTAANWDAAEPAFDPTAGRLYVKGTTEMVEFAPILLREGTAQTADYTLALADLGRVVAFNSASARTLTVPTNASIAFPIGSVIYVYNLGAGAVTIAGSGVTLRNAATTLAQYKEASLRKRDTDEWVVTGL
jgi:hypothetical protein